MGFEAWLVLFVVVLCVGVMAVTRTGPDLVLLGGVAVLLALGVITPADALAGFANPAVLTIAFLYVVAAGVRNTGGLSVVVLRFFGRPRSETEAQLRMMGPVTALSAFVNNTPVVATFIPALEDWARRSRISSSKLMIPLSYAAILGGSCTLIGTSTNLVVNGLLIAEPGYAGIGFFDLAWIGVPCAVAGIAYILAVGRWLLPERQPAAEVFRDPREYTVEMIVQPDSPIVGRTIEEVGLRQLPGLYLIEINRADQVLPAVSPDEVVQADDRLVFAGVVSSIVDLRRLPGLRPATDQVFKLVEPGSPDRRLLFEAVVSETCPLVGKSIREGQFRTHYRAVVIAVARNGERLRGKVGDIVLRQGDTLLLEARPSFIAQYRNSRDFLLVSPIADSEPPDHRKSGRAWAILGVLVVTASTGLLDMVTAALLGAGLMVVTGCTSAETARRSVDIQVLVVIAAAFGIGRALQVSGAAEALAHGLLAFGGNHPWLLLGSVYVATSLLTNVITNNAAAVLMFPITLATAVGLGLDFMPFAIVIMMSSSASFATPIGYQTNLMVYGPGGYHFGDFVRIGLPLNILVAAITIALVPLIWPF